MPTLSLCIIFKNEIGYIEEAVNSAMDVSDEIILVDSGSSDKSGEWAKELAEKNSKIKYFIRPWPGDFSDQKNFAVQQTQSDWILFLDADERLDKSDHQKIVSAISKSDIDAYLLPIRNYTNQFQQIGFEWAKNSTYGPGFYTTYLHRLFRRNDKFRYEGIIHERIEPSLDRNHAKTKPLDISIHHLGPLKEEKHQLTQTRYTFYEELAEKKVSAHPKDPQALWELGVVQLKLRKVEEAAHSFLRAIQMNADIEEFEVYYAMSLFHLQHWEEILEHSWKYPRSQFFYFAALAQTDPSAIQKLSEFEKLFVQTPLIVLELVLKHELIGQLHSAREKALSHFKESGWPQLIEGSYYRAKAQFDKAKPLLEEAFQKNCPVAPREYLILLGQMQNWKEIVRLQEMKKVSEDALKNTDIQSIMKLASIKR